MECSPWPVVLSFGRVLFLKEYASYIKDSMICELAELNRNLMLNQAGTDRLELAKLLNISDNQLSYITNVEAGRGLLKCGSAIVPCMDSYPRDSIYRLITTRPLEVGA